MPKPKFRLFGGPNGSCKTHVFKKFKERGYIHTEIYFAIHSGILNIGPSIAINSYHGSFVASYLAEKLFATQQSFSFETVMSHKSKIELMQSAHSWGYKTYLYFIFADTIETNVARVNLRVLNGGHPVNEETIKKRAPRTFELLPAAFKEADSAYVIDNSNETKAILIKEEYTIHRATLFPNIIKNPLNKVFRDFDGDVLEMGNVI